MDKVWKKVLNYLNVNRKNIFLLDGIGALLSAFFLGIVLVKYESFFGMPKQTLYLLASIPMIFAIYDTLAYFLVKEKGRIALKLISFANLGYCAFSVFKVLENAESLTIWGAAYFIIEILLVASIAQLELNISYNKTLPSS